MFFNSLQSDFQLPLSIGKIVRQNEVVKILRYILCQFTRQIATEINNVVEAFKKIWKLRSRTTNW